MTLTTGTASENRSRLSLLVVGSGALILLSLFLPFFRPPFGGDYYWQWMCGITILLGVISLLRRERGSLAIVARCVTAGAAGLLLLTVLVPFAYSLVMRLFMHD